VKKRVSQAADRARKGKKTSGRNIEKKKTKETNKRERAGPKRRRNL